MSLEDIHTSYDMSVCPPEDIVNKIAHLIPQYSKEETEKRDLLHVLNIISHKNKEQWLPVFFDIVENHWKGTNK